MTTDRLFAVEHDIVVISGAAGLLGREYVRAFLERGARVVGLDLRESPALVDAVAPYADRFTFAACDITRPADLEAALAITRAQAGEPTVLVNNAALDTTPGAPADENGPFETYSDELWNRVMDVNVNGTYLSCKVFGGAMAACGRGSIINVSSIYGVVAPDQRLYDFRRRRGETFFKPAAYAVSKSAVLNLTRYLAVYWANHGVRVNTLVIAGVENGQDPEFQAAYCSRIPTGRMADRREYNGAMLFLASDASRYMTGAQLVVDGGWTAI